MPAQYLLPDLLSIYNRGGGSNPHCNQAGAESAAWLGSFNLFSPKKQDFFERCSLKLLASYTYPYAGYEQFRLACDFLNLVFAFDEVSDDLDGKDAKAVEEVVLRALSDPEYDNQEPLVRMTKEFRNRYMRFAGPHSSRRFLFHFEQYLNAVTRGAEIRQAKDVLDLQSYVTLRRANSGAGISLDLIEAILGIDIPDEVFAEESFQGCYLAAVDMICWSNDLYSYNVEQAKGLSANNVITVLMKTKGTDVQAACDYIGAYFESLMETYQSARAHIPSWGPKIDAEVAQFVEAAVYWVRGNLEWSFEAERYFGPEHLQIKDTRLVTLRAPGSSGGAHAYSTK